MDAIIKRDNPTTLVAQDFSRDQIELIKSTVAKGTSDDELKLFLYVAKKNGLDPLTRQIHAVMRWDKKQGQNVMTIQTGIDGYRLKAEKSGKYAGNDDYEYVEKNGRLIKATATVWKMLGNQRIAFKASAFWDEYYPSNEKQRFMWNKMPHLMLGKCAEALALRKAFPQDLSGIYVDEEMQQADVIEIKTIQSQTNVDEPKSNGNNESGFLKDARNYYIWFNNNGHDKIYVDTLKKIAGVNSAKQVTDVKIQNQSLDALEDAKKELIIELVSENQDEIVTNDQYWLIYHMHTLKTMLKSDVGKFIEQSVLEVTANRETDPEKIKNLDIRRQLLEKWEVKLFELENKKNCK
jgi:phage recombination protein Bet